MTRYLGCLDDVQLDDNGPDGLYLVLTSDVGRAYRLRVTDVEALVAAVEPLRRHLADGQAVARERREHLLNAERASWGAYDLSGETEGEWLRYAADLTRKRIREERA